MAREIKVLRQKIENGADFALTQPIYDPADLTQFVARYEMDYGLLTLPILAGVLPLYNARHADFLHNEVPGINIPAETRQRMRNAGEKGAQEGAAMARELIQQLRPHIQGIYLMPPFDRYDLAAEVIEATHMEEVRG
jgi:homocysteine S-methyltransferase